MLLSMTGFGEAHCQEDGLAVGVEARTINSRYFKLSLRCGEGYGVLEPEIERVVREQIHRGTVQIGLRIDRARSADDYHLDVDVLASYRRQLEQLHQRWHVVESVPLDSLLVLPGVVVEKSTKAANPQDDWPIIRRTLTAAMENLANMRAEEGRAMEVDLKNNAALVSAELKSIQARAPEVITAYRARLSERLTKTLAEFEVSLDASDLIREVSIYAERSDISEETVRLESHLEQFASIVDNAESCGRKLEFLTQEMFRETNTIGSKANDVAIARHVIEIKAAIERIREMIQNIE